MEKISELINIIKNAGNILAEKTVTAGFDGFVDTIVKVIRDKPEQGLPVFFSSIKDFGNYILEKNGTSFSLELQQQHLKLGGNMPIMANAFGKLGVNVNCIGAFGYPQIHSAFKVLPSNCHLFSFAEPGTATALEYNDGKIMLAHMGDLNTFGWKKITNIIGIDTMINLYKESDIVCIVNWSEIDASTDIWKGILNDVLPQHATPRKKQVAFFDLSDCSKRSNETIVEALALLKQFASYCKVILSLNRNEARHIFKVLYDKDAGNNLVFLGERIFGQIDVDVLLLHSPKEAIAFTSENSFTHPGFFIDHPVISTGAGDNFNTGFCVAQLLSLDVESSILFANAVAAFYIMNGTSPGFEQVVKFLEKKAVDL